MTKDDWYERRFIRRLAKHSLPGDACAMFGDLTEDERQGLCKRVGSCQ